MIKVKKYIHGALVSNAASMGFNWIYNMPYLERLEKEQDLTFQKADPAKYKRARKAVLAYPYAKVGDVSLQGEIAKWLYKLLQENPQATKDDYETMVFENIKPGGHYRGWIESYGQKLIYNKLTASLKTDNAILSIEDDQLVGFIPYIVSKELSLPNEKAWEMAQVFTNNEDYLNFYTVFDNVLENLKTMAMKDALKAAIPLAPRHFGFKLTMALQMDDSKSFVQQLAETSCAIQYAIPLTFNILANTASYEEAVKLNTRLGGASSDRGMLLGMLYAQISEIPKSWLAKTNFN